MLIPLAIQIGLFIVFVSCVYFYEWDKNTLTIVGKKQLCFISDASCFLAFNYLSFPDSYEIHPRCLIAYWIRHKRTRPFFLSRQGSLLRQCFWNRDAKYAGSVADSLSSRREELRDFNGCSWRIILYDVGSRSPLSASWPVACPVVGVACRICLPLYPRGELIMDKPSRY